MEITKIITITYIAIQVTICLFVSIFGAIHVKKCNQPKTKNNMDYSNKNYEAKITAKLENKLQKRGKIKGFWKLWAKTTWKMRGIYGHLAVHSFDILTDILVIIEWINQANIQKALNAAPDTDIRDTVDVQALIYQNPIIYDIILRPRLMAYVAIAILFFSRIISTFAVYVKERNILSCVAQFFDLLIFSEIYATHKNIVYQVTTDKVQDKNEAIEPTYTFRYVRHYEAVFEAIPECILQLVYVIRTSSIKVIFVVSIIQSIVSMSQSILCYDHMQMRHEKWKKYKQAFPPTLHYIKHSLFRLCEVMYRIGLLALLWSVCGGIAFAIFMLMEISLLTCGLRSLIKNKLAQLDGETVLLTVTSLIIIPSEYFYAYGAKTIDCDCHSCDIGCYILNCCCGCPTLCGFIMVISRTLCCIDSNKVNLIPFRRICVSCFEFMFLIYWGVLTLVIPSLPLPMEVLPLISRFERRGTYLFSFDYGASILIASSICFAVCTQYLLLFPDFSLALGINARSKWGYAFANQLTELIKVRTLQHKYPYKIEITEQYAITDDASFLDQPYEYQGAIPITASIIAMIRGHTYVVKWLESQGAMSHKHIDEKYIVLPFDEDQAMRMRGLANDNKDDIFAAAFFGDLDTLIKMHTKVLWNELVDNDKLMNVVFNYLGRKYLRSSLKCDGSEYQNSGVVEINVYIRNITHFHDEPIAFVQSVPITPIILALSNGHSRVVEWLEDKGVVSHKSVNVETMKNLDWDRIETELKHKNQQHSINTLTAGSVYDYDNATAISVKGHVAIAKDIEEDIAIAKDTEEDIKQEERIHMADIYKDLSESVVMNDMELMNIVHVPSVYNHDNEYALVPGNIYKDDKDETDVLDMQLVDDQNVNRIFCE
eukprot:179794_1